ncbi:MAG TPA: phospholipase D-like domain-containing protein [Flavisolibacter sp.]|jgi:hypothetical protein|nr:phospholipase D-like domain-containing protein [Flavisolibacter sp.]
MRLVKDNISICIANYLDAAKETICVAVAWFTNPIMFKVLVEKLRSKKVKVELLISDHEHNFKKLPFQTIIDLNGKLWIMNTTNTSFMHNKFCIIDNKIVITGSYNWSYSADYHKENILVIDNEHAIAVDYLNYFNELITVAQEIKNFKNYKDVSIERAILETEDSMLFTLANRFESEAVKNLYASKKLKLKVNFDRLEERMRIFTAVGTAKFLATSQGGNNIQTGIEQLAAKGKLKLSFEYLICKPEYSKLFDPIVINMAKKKLLRLNPNLNI